MVLKKMHIFQRITYVIVLKQLFTPGSEDIGDYEILHLG